LDCKEQDRLASDRVKKKPLRVALIASERTVCEHSMFLERILVGLADESVPVALVCPPDCRLDAVFTGTAEVIRHPVFDLPLMGRLNLRLLVERLSKFNPTIMHCLCETQAFLTAQLAHRLDLPLMLTVNSLQKRRSSLPIASPHCRRVIVPAKSIADNLAGLYPRLADLIQQINIGTFVANASGCFSRTSAVPTMVLAHPIDKADALENLFGVARHLLIDGYEFMMVVVGGGRADRQLWKLLAALGLLSVVTLVPRLLPWRLVLASGDIFIRHRPSRFFDFLLLEAMGVGTAVAGCRGGVDDLIIENQTAIVFDPDDEQSIMRTLKQFLDRRELACQIARSAQDYLRQNYTVSRMISDIFQTYREVLE
jgi:glycosyltransferase involved in cell wall biosynthesis